MLDLGDEYLKTQQKVEEEARRKKIIELEIIIVNLVREIELMRKDITSLKDEITKINKPGRF